MIQDTTALQQAILDSANYAMIATTVEGTILTFNPAAEAWLGYAAAEVIEQATPVIFHDQSEIEQRAQALSQELGAAIEPGFEALIAQARRGETDEREWTYIRKDGSQFPVKLSVTALRDPQNKITGFLSIGSDITQQKQAAAERSYQRQRSQLFADITLKIRQSLKLEDILQMTVTEVLKLLQSDRVMIFRLNPQGSGTVVKEAVAPGWPVILDQDINDSCFQESYIEQYRQGRVGIMPDIQQMDIAPCYVEMLQPFGVRANLVVPILQAEQLWGLLITHQCSGPRQWTETEAQLLRQLADQVGIALAQAQLVAALRESEARFRTMADSAPVLLWMSDPEGQCQFFNQSWLTFTGRRPEQEAGEGWTAGIHPEDLSSCLETYANAFALRQTFQSEYRLRRADGEYRWVLDTGIPRFMSDGSFAGYIGSCVDISDRREIERLKDEFVSVVSHELRTPLTSIRGALGLLAGGVLQTQPEKAQRMLNIAVNNTDRLVRLINDILDIERIESGKVTMSKQTCEAADLISQAAEVVRSLAQKAGVTLVLSPLSVRLWADPDRIIQTFTNLLSNAIKFSPSGSSIRFGAELLQNNQILFQVKDQGRGIPANKIETIFERFQQVDASDSRKKGGTGLGLAICRSIVQHHGGQIWIESTLGQGSTAFLSLPVLPTEAISSRINFNDPLVLVCDDDPSVRTVVQSMLEQQGYQVITVASGQEAIAEAAAQQPDVILLNLMMPGMPGWETLAILKQQSNTQAIPTIILSGLLPDARESPYPEIVDWIVKPPDQQRLFQALERALAKHNQTVKVLVVEDDLDLAQVLLSMFERYGIETYHAQTGQEAIQLSQNILPDLLVLDLVLPQSDGFAVVDWLRQHNRLCRVPLVVYTAKDLEVSERERLKLGQTLLLTKGRITPHDFERRVLGLLNRIMRGDTYGNQTDSSD